MNSQRRIGLSLGFVLSVGAAAFAGGLHLLSLLGFVPDAFVLVVLFALCYGVVAWAVWRRFKLLRWGGHSESPKSSPRTSGATFALIATVLMILSVVSLFVNGWILFATDAAAGGTVSEEFVWAGVVKLMTAFLVALMLSAALTFGQHGQKQS